MNFTKRETPRWHVSPILSAGTVGRASFCLFSFATFLAVVQVPALPATGQQYSERGIPFLYRESRTETSAHTFHSFTEKSSRWGNTFHHPGSFPGGIHPEISAVAFVWLEVQEQPLPFVPKQETSEEEWDRIESLALYSAGRLLELEGRPELALRRYQRAVRYDPTAEAPFQAAIRLAIRLGRLEEAARLLRAYGRRDGIDLSQLLQIGLYLVQRGQYSDAAKVLELAAEQPAKIPSPTAAVALRLELGRLYYLAGTYDKAAAQFRQVLAALRGEGTVQIKPEEQKSLMRQPGITWRMMGGTFLRTKEWELAEYCFRQAYSAEPNDPLLKFDLARVWAGKGDWATAEVALREYLVAGRDSEGLEPYHLLREILRALGKETELLSILSELHANQPQNLPLTHSLAEEYFRQGLLEEADRSAEEVLAQRPTAETWRLLVDIRLKAGRWQALLRLLGKLVAEGVPLEGISPELREKLAAAPIREELMKALEGLAGSVADPAELQGAKAALALLAITAQDFPTAQKLVQELAAERAELFLEILLELAFALAEAEKHDTACELLSSAITSGPKPEDVPILRYYLAGFLVVAGRTEEALLAARQALEANRENPRFQLRLAWIYLYAKRHAEATSAYRELLERWEGDHSSSELRQVIREAKLALSHLALQEEKFDEAVEWLEQVLDEFPEDPSALNDLGYIWADRNMRLNRAFRMIQKAVEADPTNPAYRDSLGWVLFRLGHPEEAVVELEKAAQAEPDPVILDHLGDVYKALGKLPEARKAWNQAREKFLEQNNSRGAEEVQKKLEALSEFSP